MKVVLVLMFFLTSCASYVQSLHKQIDNEQRARRSAMLKARQASSQNQRPQRTPVTLSANSNASRLPDVRRNYNSKGVRRYKANDLVDNDNDGSLWSGQNSESFLFVNNNLKRAGDIVIVEVMKDLKDKIQEELKRAFPERKKPGKKAQEPTAEASEQTAQTDVQADNPNKVYDKISTSVVEQVNQDYLLIRGRKEVMYKKFKRYFEIQAVVSQKDISSSDTVSSTKLLEPKINVLRY